MSEEELRCWSVWNINGAMRLGHAIDGEAPTPDDWTRIGTALIDLRQRADATREASALHARAARLEGQHAEQLDIADKIIAERDRVLDALPCPVHGRCVPHALDQVASLRSVAEAAKTWRGEAAAQGTREYAIYSENAQALIAAVDRWQRAVATRGAGARVDAGAGEEA